MSKLFLMHLILIILPTAAFAQDEIDRGYVNITVEYRSMFPGDLQIRDGVCRPARDIECEKARIKVMGDFCQQNPNSHQCVEAAALLGSSLCIAGLIFDGRAGNGEKITVSICAAPSGFGNMYVRDTKNGPTWTYYPLLKNDDTVIYP